MFKAELVNTTNTYQIGWFDGKVYTFNASTPSVIIPETLKEHIEPLVDYKNNPIFKIKEIAEEVLPEKPEEAKDDTSPQEGKAKKISKRAVE